MAKQKTASKTKEKATKPKPGKKRRPKEQIVSIKKMGEVLAGIAGAIIALSQIRWMAS